MKTKVLWVKFDASIARKIEALSLDECRPISSVIRQAVKEFLERRGLLSKEEELRDAKNSLDNGR